MPAMVSKTRWIEMDNSSKPKYPKSCAANCAVSENPRFVGEILCATSGGSSCALSGTSQ